jgi:putative membrane protein
MWTWHPHLDIWAALLLLAVGYAWAIGRLGPRHVGSEPATSSRKAFLFYLGLFVLWLGADWPLHDISERSSFAAHMVQHLLFTFVAPPLLLLGVPTWLWRVLFRPRWIFKAVSFATRPLIAFVVFNGVVAITHWPTLVNLSIESTPVHFVVHYAMIISALMMWWPVVAPLPEMPRLSEPMKMFYLFLQSILPTVPASFLTFSSAPVYSGYEGFTNVFGISAHVDQQIAGLIMKIGGGLLLWTIIAVLFFRWHAKEEAGEVEEVSWEDFERELQARDLRR